VKTKTKKIFKMKKNLYKAALMAALGLAGVTAAQAQINNNDLVLGFTSQFTGVTQDYLIDLGPLPSNIPANYNTPLSVSGFNSATFGGIFDTALANNAVNLGIVGSTPNGDSGGEVILSILDNGTGTPTLAGSLTPPSDTESALANASDIPTTLVLGPVSQSANGSFFNNVAENPTTPGIAGNNSFTGYSDNPLSTLGGSESILLDLYENTFAPRTASSWVYAGDVSVDVSGDTLTATFDPVPEPGTALIAGISGLSLVLLRRRFNRNA
jgi:hypothetical protein